MSQTKTVALPDGRTLAYDEYGPGDGTPVFCFHGNPGSRRLWALFEDAAERLGARVVAPDRPGFGRSDFRPGRELLDWPADVSALADHLGVESFAVVGFSAGVPTRRRAPPRSPNGSNAPSSRRRQRRRNSARTPDSPGASSRRWAGFRGRPARRSVSGVCWRTTGARGSGPDSKRVRPRRTRASSRGRSATYSRPTPPKRSGGGVAARPASSHCSANRGDSTPARSRRRSRCGTASETAGSRAASRSGSPSDFRRRT
ncbi:alpha/beta fold hydrolase [Halorussus caseinilyticus]|uniref:alpha/beta fold hydrolase n=1 Tax=Halorussus caseinilyticus TaxID=3034025 RepID=UPI003B21178C